jgi:two-component system, NtrC family, sensor histidine kinase PilS
MAASEKRLEPGSSLDRKLWGLILGRLGAALILLLLSTIWSRNSTDPESSTLTLSVLLFVLFLTLIYSLAHRFSQRLLFQARIQFIVDILLVTWLVWTSDVIYSPYTALYIVIISTSSLFLGPRGAIITSVGCAVAFTGCALLVMTGFGKNPTQYVFDETLSRAVQSVGLFNIAFFVVGLLSARLAEQQSGSEVRLRAATQSLANLRALHERIVESIRSGVVTTDLEGRIFTFNAAAEEITGYDEKDVRGQGASVFFGELTDHITNLVQASDLRSSPRFEADCLTAEGMRLRLGFSISPLSSESGETTGMVITFQDLTHIRALEETSRRQDQLAAIGRMAASIAHEIRNPLAAMRGSIQMLRHEMQGESTQAELMEIILRESDRLNRIITDFLNYARPRSASHAKVDIGELLHQTFTLLRYSPEINEHQSVEDEVIDGPLMADADAEQLQQVFWNLARNALQSMPEGGTLRAEVAINARNRISITFRDTGRGMSPAQVEHLFEPFSSTTGGTGLGLSIVYQIIREHGGTINIRSREGQGTTISIELPVERAEGRTEEFQNRTQYQRSDVRDRPAGSSARKQTSPSSLPRF